jgi:hypothetical protein
MKIRYELADSDEGTVAKIRIQSIGENEYQIPPAALNRAVNEWITNDLKRLKQRVEGPAD